jgi:23S rRNA pseudouridine2605 synthase
MNREGERLQKVLARAGLGSRRAMEGLIEKGRVTVNGKRAELGRRVDPDNDEVKVDGSTVVLRTDRVYYMVNKPEGYITSATDPEGRPTVGELVDPTQRVWPVGRLDIETEGLLLMTNDGELTHRLTHPSFEVAKTYLAEVVGGIRSKAIKQLIAGVALEDGVTAPAQVTELDRDAHRSLLEITVHEGRNRMVRRMLATVGHPVTRLVRVQVGPIKLGRLKPGTVRKLSPEEVSALYRTVGL